MLFFLHIHHHGNIPSYRNFATTNNFQDFPIYHNIKGLEYFPRIFCDGFETVGGKCKNGRPCTRQTDAEQSRVRGWCD